LFVQSVIAELLHIIGPNAVMSLLCTSGIAVGVRTSEDWLVWGSGHYVLPYILRGWYTDKYKDRQIDGWVDGWMDGWMDGWIDR
jgi:hypothetical protein